MRAICSVEGCERQVHARHLCGLHYARNRRNGDPVIGPGRGKTKNPKPVVHGSNRAYQTFGCRCEVCMEGSRARARAYYKNYTERVAQKRRIKKYGLTPAEHDAMLARQGGVCAICGAERPDGKPLYVDHCHETGQVRSLLCTQCNTGLGMFGDDPDRMLAAATYVLQYRDVLGEVSA